MHLVCESVQRGEQTRRGTSSPALGSRTADAWATALGAMLAAPALALTGGSTRGEAGTPCPVPRNLLAPKTHATALPLPSHPWHTQCHSKDDSTATRPCPGLVKLRGCLPLLLLIRKESVVLQFSSTDIGLVTLRCNRITPVFSFLPGLVSPGPCGSPNKAFHTTVVFRAAHAALGCRTRPLHRGDTCT